jgi:DNA-binding ferritin-like protein
MRCARITKRLGERLGEASGNRAVKKADDLADAIKAKFDANNKIEVLDDLAKAPDDKDIQASVRHQLKRIMSNDEEFAHELAKILKKASEAGADTTFHTTIYGDVQKLVQMGNVYGDVEI